MPKVDGLSKEQNKAILADALADEGSEPIDLPVSKPIAAAPVAAPAQTNDVATLVALLADALKANGAANTDAIKQAMTESAAAARNPMAETYLSGGYPAKSVFSHPDGDLAHPRSVLRCPMFLGVYDSDGKTTPAFEVFGDVCTEQERTLFNQLTPGEFWVERNDGKRAKWRVVEQQDDFGQPVRLIVAVPQTWLKSDEQGQMPTQKYFLRQLVDAASVAA